MQINPSRRETLPTTPQGILDRLDEITFNSSLVKELRSLALLQQLLSQTGEPAGGGRPNLFSQVAALRMHRIHSEAELAKLGATSKIDTGWPFLSRLHHIGYRATHDWLDSNFTHLGRRSTVALDTSLT